MRPCCGRPRRRGFTVLSTAEAAKWADVIVILGGGVPFREREAAQLYRDGWAPKLMIVREAQQERQILLAQIGVPWDEWVLRSQVLERLGVPPSALTIPDGEAFGTLEELQAVMAALPPAGGTAILVTSLQHTRRAGLVWRSVAPPQWRVIVHSAPQDPFDPDIWWRDRRFALAVAQEYLGLANMWLGSPVMGRTTVAAGAGAGAGR
ncbi:MAG: YdcF family protein [Chloroflexi bacterium]|nr:YdcF family protein [Chloroflexota bacterium]